MVFLILVNACLLLLQVDNEIVHILNIVTEIDTYPTNRTIDFATDESKFVSAGLTWAIIDYHIWSIIELIEQLPAA